MQLQDSVIIITGGGQGLGRAMGEFLAAKGAKGAGEGAAGECRKARDRALRPPSDVAAPALPCENAARRTRRAAFRKDSARRRPEQRTQRLA